MLGKAKTPQEIAREIAEQIVKEFQPFTVVEGDNEYVYGYDDGYYQPLADIDLKHIIYKATEGLASTQFVSQVMAKVKAGYSYYKQLKIDELWDFSNNGYSSGKTLFINPYEINLMNGRLNIKDNTFSPHTPSAIDFWRVPVTYNPDAYSKEVEDFLNAVFQNDEELFDLFKEMLGLCLTRNVKDHQCFILYGEGANGKSTLFKMIRAFVGSDNCSSLGLDELGKKFRIGEIKDKLVNLGDDSNFTTIKDTGTFKKLVSGDTFYAEQKYKNVFTMTPYATMLFSCNILPKIEDYSEGISRRISILPLMADFSGGKSDRNIINSLITENAKSYLLNLAIEGYQRILTNECLTIPACVEKLTEEFVDEINLQNNPMATIIEWFKSQMMIDDERRYSGPKFTKLFYERRKSEIYRLYKNYCICNKVKYTNNTEFKKYILGNFEHRLGIKTVDGYEYYYFKVVRVYKYNDEIEDYDALNIDLKTKRKVVWSEEEQSWNFTDDDTKYDIVFDKENYRWDLAD